VVDQVRSQPAYNLSHSQNVSAVQYRSGKKTDSEAESMMLILFVFMCDEEALKF
jgi:hypothetical protein